MRVRGLCRAFPALVILAVLPGHGCYRSAETPDRLDVNLRLVIQPDPPRVGPALTTVQLTDTGGAPVKGATLRLEGNMSHAGMKPSFASAREVEPGKYEATLDITMGGDWFVLISGTLADGSKLNRKVDVPRVKSR
ncbi:MAG TPA: FixH family protein [Gemmataceae bacterium]|jgi:hypothetical protein|nr:FixH family protein [Gemmataceae bacterium]